MKTQLQVFLCDTCGFSKDLKGLCPFCEIPLTRYDREDQREFQTNLEDAMRAFSEYRWYV